jgi:hypothetical protein
MCFSASASFSAGIALTVVGALTLKKVNEPREIPLALIPLIFGVQQIAEGFVWLGLQHTAYASFELKAAYVFLFFAQVLWPTWVPFSMLLVEKKKRAQKILTFLLLCGVISSVFLCRGLIRGPISADCEGMHVAYHFFGSNSPESIISLMYFMAIVFSPFVSTFKNMWWIGVLVAASFLVAYLFYAFFLISVWCFFAAIISVTLYSVISREKSLR